MQYFIKTALFSTMVFIMCRCSETANNDTSTVDSNYLNSVEMGRKDSVGASSDTDTVVADIINEYVKGYHNKKDFDSTYISNGDIVQVDFRHYCVFDNAITVPKKYVSIYGLEKFVTHNFESTLKITNGDKVVIDTIIKKSQFNDYLDEPLRTYGVLLYPEVRVKDAILNIDYSVSVPLTDVGVRMEVRIDSQGGVDVKKI